MKPFNKLVRDKIPQIIKDNGDKLVTHEADDTEYWEKLKAKLHEEVLEVLADTNVKEELADLLEVIHAISAFQGFTMDELEQTRLQKKAARGGFDQRIILDETNDGQE